MYNPPNVNTSFSHKRKFVKSEQNETTRYLGNQVGVLPLAHTNWEVRIRAIKRRVITATNCGTSVIERIQVFIAVIISAILFPAKMFPPSPAVLKQLVDIQKKFIWGNQSNEDKTRHKISPLLIYIPRRAGGLGLISIPVVIHTLMVKEATCWLLQQRYLYSQAWREYSGLSKRYMFVSPRPHSARIPTTVRKEST
ncbi:hypothetical protein PsorP6_004853 [Peronosclerospora sorghi]|uniref:Uncharacterized protein n=1 Tax=Peronosclerospora sorghi TaxID=230839 RepID=A0ACC0W4H5_9STRA|nr:hypothetical protein PsorP6_004853 [Peronosclerospora sorghi]